MERPATAVNETLRRNSLRVYFLFSMFSTRWKVRWRFGFQRLESWLMRIMAVSTEIIRPFTRPHKVSGSFPVNACLPISILRPVTFTAEPVALRKVDQFPVVQPQLVAVLRIVTVEAPPHGLGMMEFDLRVLLLQFPFFSIYLHGGVAIAARKHSFSHRRRLIFFNHRHGRRSEKKQQEQRSYCCIKTFHDPSITFILCQRSPTHLIKY